MDKRGISAIVATVLIILITVAGVAIIWVAIVPMINDGIWGINEDVDLQIVTGSGYTIWDPEARLSTVQVERGNDEADLIGFDLIFNLGGNSVKHFVEAVPEINSRKVYYINLSNYSGELLSISVAPVFKNGKVGAVVGKVEIGDIGVADVMELIESGILDASDFVGPNLGFEDGGFVVPEECEAECSGLECGDDGCGGSCGSCGVGESCSGGICAISYSGNVYYVDAVNGDDSNSGASDEPWETIDRAYTWYSGTGAIVAEGDTVLFRNGSYGEFVEDTGVDRVNQLVYRDDWVTYKADVGHEPSLTSIYIDNYDRDKTMIVDCETPWSSGSGDSVSTEDIGFFGNSCKIEIQSERSAGDLLAYYNLDEPLVINETTQSGIQFYMYSEGVSIPEGNYTVVYSTVEGGLKTGDYVERVNRGTIANNWINSDSSISLKGLTIKSIGFYANDVIPDETIVYLDNINLFGNGRSYLYFEGFRINDGVNAQDTAYLKFIDCDIESAPASIDGSLIEGYYEPYFPFNSYGIYFGGVDNVVVEGCEVSNTYRGIYASGDHYIIKNNTVHHLAADGILVTVPPYGRLSADDILVEDNLVYDIRGEATQSNVDGIITGTFNEGDIITQGTTGIQSKVISSTATRINYYLLNYSTVGYGFTVNSDSAYDITGPSGVMSLISATDGPHTDIFQIDISKPITNLVITGNTFDRKRAGADPGNGTKYGQGIKIYGEGDELISVTMTNNLVVAGVFFIGGGLKDAIINNNTFISDRDNPDLIITHGFRITTLGDRGSSTIAEFNNNIVENLLVNEVDAGETITFVSHDNNIFGYSLDGNPPELFGNEIRLADDTEFKALFFDVSNMYGVGGGDYNSLEGTIACDGSVNGQYGVAVGALPCVPKPCPGGLDSECDDGNSCTNDVCSSLSCEYSFNTNSCDDGYDCTTNDVCSDGVCQSGTANNDICLVGNCASVTCNPALFPMSGCGNYLPVNCNYVVPDDYLSYWKFDDDVLDSGLWGNNGILQNEATLIEDFERGSVLNLDGNGDHVEIPNSSSLDSLDDDVSISFWRFTGENYTEIPSNYRYVFGSVKDDSDGIGAYYSDYGRLVFLSPPFEDNNRVADLRDCSYVLNEWANNVFVFDSEWIISYQNGVECTRKPLGTNLGLLDDDARFYIGSSKGNDVDLRAWKGLIDDFMIYNRSLNAEEIGVIYCGQGGTVGC